MIINTKTDMSAYRTSVEQDVIDIGKVDKVAGKGLSTNDYDNTEKGKVASNTASRHSHANKEILDQVTGVTQPTTIGIDTVVTENSTNLITSGAVYSVLGDVESLLEALR